jgi:glucokinase
LWRLFVGGDVPSTVVLGIDFGGTKIGLAVGDLDGARLGTAVISSGAGSGARASLDGAVSAAHALLGRAAPGARLGAVGVSTFGIPGPDGVELAPAIDGWAQLGLERELAAAFGGVPVRVVTDVKAAAQVEADQGALAGCDPGLYLNLGTGLAAAIVADGKVISGRHGASGEIGYNLRGLADVGRLLDDRTPLELVVSGGALLAAAAGPAPGISGADLFARAPHEPALAAVLDTFLTELAFHLVNLTIAVDPQRIAVGGGMVRSWDLLRGPLRAALDAAVPYPPELVTAAFPYDAPLIGALAHGVAAATAQLAPAEKETLR